MKRDLARKHARFYIIDAAKLAGEIGLGKHTNNILQGAFFALTKVIPMDVAVEDMKKNNYATYFKKAGQKIVDMNDKAVDVGVHAAVKVDVPASWADAQDAPAPQVEATPFVKEIVMPMDRQQGDKLPVSVFQKHGVLDGTWENGTSAYSKRGVATSVPKWDAAACIQCNRCAMSCPHAAIRPVLLTEEEKASVPAEFVTAPAKGLGKDAPAYRFRMQVSPYDCLGCGVCLTVCPAKEKGALTMAPFEEMKCEQPLFDQVAMNEKYLKKDAISDKSVKNAQFAKPYYQFSSACAGCAETTYIKLLSQLFGDHMYVGNAAGCSSAISGGAPILPYCKDCQGHGPAWEHSLFEDNAEFAYGFFHAQDSIRKELLLRLEKLQAEGVAPEAIGAYLNGWNDQEKSRAVTDALIAAHRGVFQYRRTILQGHPHQRHGEVLRRRQAGSQEGSGRHFDAVRLCICGPGGHGRRPGPDAEGPAGGRGLRRPLHRHLLLPLPGAAHQNRFAALKNNFPERADALYAKEIADVKARYAKYKRMAEEN